MFKVGDNVVEKNNPPPIKFGNEGCVPLLFTIKKGEVMKIKNIMFCLGCGNQFLDFNHALPSEFSHCTHVMCHDCGNATPKISTAKWYRALDFEKVIYNNISEEIANKISEVKETSDQPILNPNPQPERVEINTF